MKRLASRRAKALDIRQKVKKTVWERDGKCCILCGNPEAMPNAHIVPRSHGGLGIEQNVVTLCRTCHTRMDQTTDRPMLLEQVTDYIKAVYPGWTPESVTYKKYGGCL